MGISATPVVLLRKIRKSKIFKLVVGSNLRSSRIRKLMFRKMMTKTTATVAIILFLGVICSTISANGQGFADYEVTNVRSNSFSHQKLSTINDSFLNRPILDIAKTVNSTEIDPDASQWIRVNISISNLGNATAFNLTTTDPAFESWAITSMNITIQSFVIVEPNATIFYYYYFRPVIEGNFTLEPTNIVYFDVNSTEYYGESQRYIILSIKPENIELINTELWLNILYYSLAIIAGIGGIVLFDLFVFKRSTGVKKRKPKAKTKTGPAQQRSKKQQKKKTQKRR